MKLHLQGKVQRAGMPPLSGEKELLREPPQVSGPKQSVKLMVRREELGLVGYTHTHTPTRAHTHVYTYIYICIYTCHNYSCDWLLKGDKATPLIIVAGLQHRQAFS